MPYLARVERFTHPLLSARLEGALEPYPDPQTLRLRFDRLLRANPAAAGVLTDESDSAGSLLIDLLSLGDAPLDEVIRHPHLLRPLLDPRNLDDPFAENPPPLPKLARFKRHIWLKIMLRDRSRLASYDQTTHDLTRLADLVAELAMQAISATTQPVVLFALGKWGGGELNAASDIDPVFFAPSGNDPMQNDRTVRAWTNLVSGAENGEEVYPVDLRLRPEGVAGPLAWKLDEVERYFFQRAAPWERIAYLRARYLSGPLPDWFNEVLEQFLFGGILDPKRRVSETARALRAVHSTSRPRDLKRAPGGIRDVEFLVASFQLLEGPTDPALRHGAVPQLLRLLRDRAALTAEEFTALDEGYRLLRQAEHALQVEEDRPRFILPPPESPLHRRLAYALHLPPEQLEDVIAAARSRVAEIVDRLLLNEAQDSFPGASLVDPQADKTNGDTLSLPVESTGMSAIVRRLTGPWGPAAALIETSLLAKAQDPAEAMTRLESAVNAYGGPRAWLAVLEANPRLKPRITQMLCSSPRLLDEANSRPYLYERVGSVASELSMELPASGKLDDYLGDMLFSLGDRFLAGEMDAEALTTDWTNAVDRVIRHLAENGFVRSAPAVALLALGKWGGGELAPDADLDLMFVCDETDASTLAAVIQGATQWMQLASLGGRLMLDARLRPEGGVAPLVITLSRLQDYLASRAQPWEKIALVRARFVAGDVSVGERALRLLQAFTVPPPSENALSLIDLARKKAAEASRPRPGVIKLKKGLGGMMDFEFAASFLGWRRQMPPGEWWYAPIPVRFRAFAEAQNSSLFVDAAEAYLELRRWDLVQLISRGHRRGDLLSEGEEAERFAHAAGMEVQEISERFREISSLGRRLYELGLRGT